jgi:MFS family permease
MDHFKQLYINGILSICNAVVAIGMCFFVDKLGRRFLFLVATFGMLIMFTVLTICAAQYAKTKDKNAANAVIVMIFLYYVCYNLAWSGPLVGYGVEILPYRIRAKVIQALQKSNSMDTNVLV